MVVIIYTIGFEGSHGSVIRGFSAVIGSYSENNQLNSGQLFRCSYLYRKSQYAQSYL